MTHPDPSATVRAAEPSHRSRWNFAIDLVSLLSFSALAGTGFLLEWGFPHGRPGSGGAWTWLGLGRHAWGELHLWLALLSVAVVVAHVVLHWGWLRNCWRRFLGVSHRPLALIVGAFLLLCLVGPFIIPAQRAAEPGVSSSPQVGQSWGHN